MNFAFRWTQIQLACIVVRVPMQFIQNGSTVNKIYYQYLIQTVNIQQFLK